MNVKVNKSRENYFVVTIDDFNLFKH
jgi:hypothetical protein